MKFKCGLTDEEEVAKRKANVLGFKQWATHGYTMFAWLPVKIRKGRCVWLEKVRYYPVFSFYRLTSLQVDYGVTIQNASYACWERAYDIYRRFNAGNIRYEEII